MAEGEVIDSVTGDPEAVMARARAALDLLQRLALEARNHRLPEAVAGHLHAAANQTQKALVVYIGAEAVSLGASPAEIAWRLSPAQRRMLGATGSRLGVDVYDLLPGRALWRCGVLLFEPNHEKRRVPLTAVGHLVRDIVVDEARRSAVGARAAGR